MGSRGEGPQRSVRTLQLGVPSRDVGSKGGMSFPSRGEAPARDGCVLSLTYVLTPGPHEQTADEMLQGQPEVLLDTPERTLEEVLAGAAPPARGAPQRAVERGAERCGIPVWGWESS